MELPFEAYEYSSGTFWKKGQIGAVAAAKDGSIYVARNDIGAVYTDPNAQNCLYSESTSLFHVTLDPWENDHKPQCRTTNDGSCQPNLIIKRIVPGKDGNSVGLDIDKEGNIAWAVNEQYESPTGCGRAPWIYVIDTEHPTEPFKETAFQAHCNSGGLGGITADPTTPGGFFVTDVGTKFWLDEESGEVLSDSHIVSYNENGTCKIIGGSCKDSVKNSDGSFQTAENCAKSDYINYLSPPYPFDIKATKDNIYFTNKKTKYYVEEPGESGWEPPGGWQVEPGWHVMENNPKDLVYRVANDPPAYSFQKTLIEENALLEISSLAIALDEYDYLYSVWENDSGLVTMMNNYNSGVSMNKLFEYNDIKTNVNLKDQYGDETDMKSRQIFYLDFLRSW